MYLSTLLLLICAQSHKSFVNCLYFFHFPQSSSFIFFSLYSSLSLHLNSLSLPSFYLPSSFETSILHLQLLRKCHVSLDKKLPQLCPKDRLVNLPFKWVCVFVWQCRKVHGRAYAVRPLCLWSVLPALSYLTLTSAGVNGGLTEIALAQCKVQQSRKFPSGWGGGN